MKKAVVVLAVLALLFSAVPVFAYHGGGYHGGGHYGGGYRGHTRGGGNGAFVGGVIGAFLGAAIVGAITSQPAYSQPAVIYPQQPAVVYQPVVPPGYDLHYKTTCFNLPWGSPERANCALGAANAAYPQQPAVVYQPQPVVPPTRENYYHHYRVTCAGFAWDSPERAGCAEGAYHGDWDRYNERRRWEDEVRRQQQIRDDEARRRGYEAGRSGGGLYSWQ